MGAPSLTCRSCGSIKQTSPTQVFWRCQFWSRADHAKAVYPREWAGSIADRHAYVSLHCHVHPDSPACPNHSKRALPKDGTDLTAQELLALREVGAGVPAGVAMACAGLVSS